MLHYETSLFLHILSGVSSSMLSQLFPDFDIFSTELFLRLFFSGRYELKMSNNKNDYYVTANISLDTSHDL